MWKTLFLRKSIEFKEVLKKLLSELEREEADLLLKYHMLQYNYMFDKKHRVNNYFEVIN